MEKKFIAAIAAGVVLLLLILTILFALDSSKRNKQAAVDAKGGQVVAEGAGQMAGEAAKAQIDLARRQAARDQLSKETDDAIRDLPGAQDPLNTGLRDAGLDRYCLRDAYANHPTCTGRVALR